MKTTFSRQFAMTASLILLSMLLMALSFQPLMRSYLVDMTQQNLSSNAEAVAKLAAAYDTSGQLENNWDFRISLDFASQVAGTDAIVCDADGRIILCSCDDFYCEHLGRALPAELVSSVAQNGSLTQRSELGGLYEGERHIAAAPIVSTDSAEIIGFVVASTQMSAVSALLSKSVSLYLLCGVAVLLLTVLACSVMARRQTQPLRDMAAYATRFGHGELDLRVPTGGHNTEELDELATSFNSMAENLSQAETRRSEFVANVSHELKTPMTSIAGFMDGMLDGTIPESEHRRYMQAVSDEVRRLSRLVREMLEVSRLRESSPENINWQVFDLCEALGQCLISFEQRIVQKKLEVEVDMPEDGCRVLAVQDAISQVIRNLLDNAVKFTPENGALRLELRVDGDKAVTTVSNTGPTIPEQELRLLFDRFHKTDKSRSVDRDGVGLGLYIVKTIMDAHGEDISVTSADGLTSFRFTLPLA